MSDQGENIQKEKSFNNEEKKKRRTRKDQEGRNFTCPCGKSYLSYPALYTHIKTKHQGKAPKDDGNGGIAKQTVEQQLQTKQPMSQTRELLAHYFEGNNIGSYPTPLPRQHHEYLENIQQNWSKIKQQRLQDPSTNLSENINTILGRYLSELKSTVTEEGYLYLCELVCNLWDSICEQNKDKQYGQHGNGTNLCQFFNTFVSKVRGKPGSPLNNSVLTCRIVQGLGAWMFEQRYTNSLAKFNIGS